MLTLLLFSLLAGMATVFSPCVLPMLPILLGAGFGSNRGRAYGIVIGFTTTFTAAILFFGDLFRLANFSGSFLSFFAIAFLFFFGLSLLFPAIGEIVSCTLQPLGNAAHRWLPNQLESGFFGGIALGFILGIVWTPCAGPILATVIVLASLRSISGEVICVALAYAMGTSLSMLLFVWGGRYLQQVAGHRSWIVGLRRGFGLLILLVAFGIASGRSQLFQLWIADHFPPLDVENNHIVQRRVATLISDASHKTFTVSAEEPMPLQSTILPVLAPQVPELQQLSRWFNSPPLTLESLKGKVVLLDFWTYSCINCLRTLPHLKRWDNRYRSDGLTILGIHTPEFAFEKESSNVAEAVSRYGISYPVAMDNDYGTWRSYQNLYWPAHYLIDQQGRLRYYHFGEGHYMETENAIRQLLGLPRLTGVEEVDRRSPLTPELYLGYGRASHYPLEQRLLHDHIYRYEMGKPQADEVSLAGSWLVGREAIIAMANDCYVELNCLAAKVHLVLSGESDQPIAVAIDGHPLTKRFSTIDVDDKGFLTVKEARKYDIADFSRDYGRHEVRLHVPKGISVYAFTFGGER